MDNNELITKARELCEKASTEKANGNAVDSAALSWAIAQNIVPQLCDVLEAAEKELIDYHHAQKVADGKTAENARLRRINEKLTARAEKAEANASHLINQAEEYKQKFNIALARAEKAEAEMSELRTPKAAVALKMDTTVQIGHVRFGPGCTIYKCPCCGMFLTSTHKYCLECGQAVSFPNSTEEE